MEKIHISADQLLRDSVELGLQVVESGFMPDLLVGIWRGGTPVAIAVHETLQFCAMECDHCTLATSSYAGPGVRGSVHINGMEHFLSKARGRKRILVVDDVFDSGMTMAAILDAMKAVGDAGTVRIATPWFKPANNISGRIPDYYLHETAGWLVFPHELEGLQPEELRQKPGLAGLTDRLLQHRAGNQASDIKNR